MKSQAPLNPLDGLLDDYAIEHLDWPENSVELDSFLTDFETDAVVANDVDILSDSCHNAQLPLFSAPEFLVSIRQRSKAVAPSTGSWGTLVSSAYRAMYAGNSIDKVVADPELRARFIQACWARDARATPLELTRALLNARKNKLIGPIPGVQPYHVPRAQLDCYLFASEIALRLVQDKEYFQSQRYVSLDWILCDEILGQQFEELARSIAPGYSSLNYRWAAITVRKAQNRRAGAISQLPSFEVLGRANCIQTRRIDEDPGFYWLRRGTADIYIGHAQNLRTQVDQILSAQVTTLPSITEMLQVEASKDFELAIAPCSEIRSASNREPLKSELVRKQRPRLNVLGGLERVA